MTLKDILKAALEIIGDEDIDPEESSKKLDVLISCANMIYTELTDEYAELRHKETVSAPDGTIAFGDLAKNCKSVVRVTKNGIKVPFKVFPAYIECGTGGELCVEYIYHPEQLASVNDEVVLPPEYTARSLSSGVASEYFYRTGLAEEALFYKNRYDNTVLNLSRKRNSFRLKNRRFI